MPNFFHIVTQILFLSQYVYEHYPNVYVYDALIIKIFKSGKKYDIKKKKKKKNGRSYYSYIKFILCPPVYISLLAIP